MTAPRLLSIIILALLVKLPARAQEAAPDTKPDRFAEMEKRLQGIESEVDRLEKNLNSLLSVVSKEQIIAAQRAKARARMREDAKAYTPEQLKEIEKLYQLANRGDSDPEVVKQNLQKVITDYPKSNRAGCATMYLAQRSEGDLRLDYLKEAETTYADCFYGDGVQVGAYALWYQAHYYWKEGDKATAEAILKQLKAKYPDAIDHKGNLLADLIPRVFKLE